MNEIELQKVIIKHFQSKLDLFIKSREQAIKSSEGAASRMEARYDSDKEDYARLAGAIGAYVDQTEKALRYFKTNNLSFFKKAKIIFVVAPFGTGEILKTEDYKIVIIHPDRAKTLK